MLANFTRIRKFLGYLYRSTLRKTRLVYLQVLGKDLKNKAKYGLNAPVFAERIYIKPAECNQAIHSEAIKKITGLHPRKASGFVVHGKWPVDEQEGLMDVDKLPKVQFCYRHFVDGVPWEETGVYEHMASLIEKRGKVDGCANSNDVVQRYQNLDQLYSQVKQEKALRKTKEVKKGVFREYGSVLIHIGPGGKPFFGGGGAHRFAIAKILNLEYIPAQIGCVHVSAIPTLKKLRRKQV